MSIRAALLGLALLATPAAAQGVKYPLPTELLACKDVQNAATYRQLLMQRDLKAVETFGYDKLKVGECTVFRKGDELTVMTLTSYEDQPYECSRLTGNPTCYWLPAFSLKAATR
jgi:hypothetical protein